MPWSREEYDLALDTVQNGDISKLSGEEVKYLAGVIGGYQDQQDAVSSEMELGPKLIGPSGEIISKRGTFAETEQESPSSTRSYYERTGYEPPPVSSSAALRSGGTVTPPPSAEEMPDVGRYDPNVGGAQVAPDPQAVEAVKGADVPSLETPYEGLSASGRKDVWFPPSNKELGDLVDPTTVYFHREPSVEDAQQFFAEHPEFRQRWGLDENASAVNENSDSYRWFADAMWQARAKDWLEKMPGGTVWRPAYAKEGWQRALGTASQVAGGLQESIMRGVLPGARSLTNYANELIRGDDAAELLGQAAEANAQSMNVDALGGLNPVTTLASFASIPGAGAGKLAASKLLPRAMAVGPGSTVMDVTRLQAAAEGSLAGMFGGAADTALASADVGATPIEAARSVLGGVSLGGLTGGMIGGVAPTGFAQGRRLREQMRPIAHLEQAGGSMGALSGVNPPSDLSGLREAGRKYAIGQAPARPGDVAVFNAAEKAASIHAARQAQAEPWYQTVVNDAILKDNMAGKAIRRESPLPWLDTLEEAARKMEQQPLANAKIAQDAVLSFYDIEAVPEHIAPQYAQAKGGAVYSPKMHPWAARGVKRARKEFEKVALPPWGKSAHEAPTRDLGPKAVDPDATGPMQQWPGGTPEGEALGLTPASEREALMGQAVDAVGDNVRISQQAQRDAADRLAYVVTRKEVIRPQEAVDFYRRFGDRMRKDGAPDRELKQLDYDFRHDVMGRFFPHTKAAIDRVARTKTFLEATEGDLLGRTPDQVGQMRGFRDLLRGVEGQFRQWPDNLISKRLGLKEFEHGMPELAAEGLSAFGTADISPMLQLATGVQGAHNLDAIPNGSPTYDSAKWGWLRRRWDVLKGATIRDPTLAGRPASMYNPMLPQLQLSPAQLAVPDVISQPEKKEREEL
jgi:hypothetical protein